MRPRIRDESPLLVGKLARFDPKDWPVVEDDGREWGYGHPAQQARVEGATEFGALLRWHAARLAVLTQFTPPYGREVLAQIHERRMHRERLRALNLN